jgi:hypothetical protein
MKTSGYFFNNTSFVLLYDKCYSIFLHGGYTSKEHFKTFKQNIHLVTITHSLNDKIGDPWGC